MHKLRVDEGEAGELGLVDVGDNQLVWWCELGLGAREELVKVLRSFATLEKSDKEKGRFRLKVYKIIWRVLADRQDRADIKKKRSLEHRQRRRSAHGNSAKAK